MHTDPSEAQVNEHVSKVHLLRYAEQVHWQRCSACRAEIQSAEPKAEQRPSSNSQTSLLNQALASGVVSQRAENAEKRETREKRDERKALH